ncbi:MAG TPA: peptidase domain-containing ABC transporter [Burkholderiales bacterium]|nr:peptidase domain-containing ABC transporter [Burkholderiales bacterium]
MNDAPLFATHTFVWGLAAICQLHRRPFAPDLVLQQFAPPYGAAALEKAAAALELKAGLRRVEPAALFVLPAPFLAILKPAPADGDDRTSPCRLALVLQCDAQNVLYLTEESANPAVHPLAEFGRDYAGVVLLCAAKSVAPSSELAAQAPAAFGFRWFVPELMKHRAIWRDVLLASLAIQLVALVAPLCTQVVIDKVIVHQTLSTLSVIAIALGIFVVFNAAMGWVRQYLVLHTGNRVDAVLGARTFEHLFALPLGYFEHRPTGVLVARLHGVETIREFVSGAAASLVLDLPFLFVFLGIMFYYNVLLTLITLGVLSVIVVMSAAIVPAIRARLDRQFLLGARNTAFVTEYVAGMETVKSLQMEPQLRARYAQNLGTYLDATFATRQLSNTYGVAAHALEQVLTFSILCVGAWLVMQNAGFTVGMLVAYQMFASRVSQPMLRLVGLWQEFQQAAVAVKRLGDIMDAPAEPYSVVPARPAASAGSLDVIDLAFRYDADSPWLYEHLTLRVAAGTCVALVGPSGSGKSTLAKLLQGFYPPTRGEIRIGGRNTRHLAANELRLAFGVVPQETTLFSGTVYDNLAVANPHASFDEIVAACALAEIHETIERLPRGYQTVVGERGVGLSGGQKQRIAIARALLKRPQVLIFDEATSNLDRDTAERLAATISRLKGKVTMLFIAHDLPSALRVDDVIRLEPSCDAEKVA